MKTGSAHPSRGSRSHRAEIPRCRRRQGPRLYRAIPDHSPERRRDALDFGQIHHRARRRRKGHPPGRRPHRRHRTGAGGAGAAAKRRTLPQAGRSTRRIECDAGAARRGEDQGARPDLERVAGSAAGRRSQRRLANGQSGLDPNARLERGRIAQPHLGMAGTSRRRRRHPRAGRESSARAKPPSGSRAAFATRTDRTAGCRGPACRIRITSMRWPATSPPRRLRPNG